MHSNGQLILFTALQNINLATIYLSLSYRPEIFENQKFALFFSIKFRNFTYVRDVISLGFHSMYIFTRKDGKVLP